MALITCPSCQSNLRVPDTAGGKKVRCPKCQTLLIVPVTTSFTAQPSSLRPPAPGRSSDPPHSLGPAQGFGIDSQRHEGGQHRSLPYSSGANQPRSADPRLDPRLQGSRQKTAFPVLAVSLFGGGAVLVIGVAVTLVLLLGGLSSDDGGVLSKRRNPDRDLHFMPDRAQVIAGIHVKKFLSSRAYKEIIKHRPAGDEKKFKSEFRKEIGIALDDVSTFLVGARLNGDIKEDEIVVVRTTKPYTANDILNNIDADKGDSSKKIGARTVYTLDRDRAFCVVEKRLIVYTKPEMLEEVLERNGKPELSANMQSALNRADFNKTAAIVGDAQVIKKLQWFAPGAVGPDSKTPNYFTVGVEAAANFNIKGDFYFSDSKTAALTNDIVLGDIAFKRTQPSLPPATRDFLNSIEMSAQGKKLTAQATVDPSFINQIENRKLIAGLFGKKGPGPDMIYMPDDAELIMGIQLNEFLSSKAYKVIAQMNPAVAQQMQKNKRDMGIAAADIETMLLGGRISGFGNVPAVAVRTNKTYTAAMILGNMNRQSDGTIQQGGHTIHRIDFTKAFCVVNGKLIVFGRPGDLQQILARNRQPALSFSMKSAVDSADFSNTVVIAMKFGPGFNLPGIPAMGGNPIPAPTYGSLEMSMGTKVTMTGNAFFPSNTSAKNAEELVQRFVTMAKVRPNMPKELRDVFDSVVVTSNGNKLVASASFAAEVIAKNMVNNPFGGFGGINPPPPPINPPPNNPPAPNGGKGFQRFSGFLPKGQKRNHNVFLKAGQRYTIEMNGAFDTYLYLYSPTGQLLRSDDDGGPGLNSRMTYIPRKSGLYRIEAGSFANNGQGAYTILVRK